MRQPKPEERKGNICVFASAQSISPELQREAYNLGGLIAENGFGVVYGGFGGGLMGAAALGARTGGQEVTGVIPGRYSDPVFDKRVLPGRTDDDTRDPYELNNKTIGAGSLENRKLMMLNLSDAVIALPGGLGTLDEIATTLEQRRRTNRTAASRLAIVNYDGFYDGLNYTFLKMEIDGTMSTPAEDLAYFATNAEDAVSYVVGAIHKATTAPPTPPSGLNPETRSNG